MLEQWWTNFQPEEYPWLGEVFVLVLILLALNLILGRLVAHLTKKFEKTHNLWDDALLEASRRPALLMIWAVGGSHVLEVIGESTDAEVFSALDQIIRSPGGTCANEYPRPRVTPINSSS